MNNAELREFCTQMIGKFKLLSDIQKEMQYETIDAKFTEWELKKLIFALNVLREEVRKYVDTADTPQTEKERVMIDGRPRIGDEVYIHGYIDEIRNDVIIIRNEGSYFGTVPSEMLYYEEDASGYGTMNKADTPQTERSE